MEGGQGRGDGAFSDSYNWFEGDDDRPTRWGSRETEFRRDLLSAVETVDAEEVHAILSSGDPRGLATRCAEGQLIVLRGAGVDRYPAFQFDRKRSEIVDVAAYANAKVGAATDPWGAADWWRTPSRVLGDRSPMDVLTEYELTRAHIDSIGKYELD